MLGVIVKVMKNVLVSGAKRIGKAFSFSAITSIIGRRSMVHLRRIGTKMLTNMKSAKWWARAVRYIRRSGLVSSVGSTGAALKQAGANNWITRGMSAFKYDARSPKEYHAELEKKTKLIESLRKKRDSLNEKALSVQDELARTPLDVSKIPDAGAKIDALAGSINQMKSGLAEIKATSSVTLSEVKGFQEDQTQANAALGEVVLKTSEGNMKVQLEGFEDMKSHNMAMHAETTENITSDITAHIDALEEQKKSEEEERRKNDWKRKFLENLLLILEWILDFPTKIKMLLFKIGLVLVAGITAVVLRYWEPIKNFFTNIWTRYVGYVKMAFGTLMGFLYKIGNAIAGFAIPIIRFIGNAVSDIISALPGDWSVESAYVRNKFDTVAKWMEDLKLEDKSKSSFSDAKAGFDQLMTGKKSSEVIREKSGAMESTANKIDPEKPHTSIVDPARIVNSADEKSSKGPKVDEGKPKNDQFKAPVPSSKDGSKKKKEGSTKLGTGTLDKGYVVPNIKATDAQHVGATTAKVSNEVKVETTTAVADNTKTESNAIDKDTFNKGIEVLAKGQVATNQNLAGSSSAIMKAAASKPPTVQKVDYNFKKASTEIKSAIG
jgi:hypothetical protein